MKTLKKTLCLVLVLALSVSMFAIAASAASYDDFADAAEVAASKYAEAADVVVGLGIINGVSGNKVDLDGTLSRAMAAKILGYLLLGEKTAEGLAASDTEFSDVAVDNWASKYIAYAASQEILTGSGGKFRPSDPVEGYSLAKMVLNALGYGLTTQTVIKDGILTTVPVNDYEGDYWATNISIDANAIGLFAGLEGVDLNKPLNRGQAMQMVFNALKIDETDADVIIDNPNYYYDYNNKTLAYAIEPSAATADGFGRPAHSWINAKTNKSVSGTYFDKPIATFAGGTTVKDIAKAIGVVNSSSAKYFLYEFNNGVNYTDFDNSENKGVRLGSTLRGDSYPYDSAYTIEVYDSTETYKNDNDITPAAAGADVAYTFVLYSNDPIYLNKDSAVKDSDTTDEDDERYIKYKLSVGENDRKITPENYAGFDALYARVSALKTGEYIVMMATSEGKSFYEPTSFTGKITAKATDGSSIYVDGNKYTVNNRYDSLSDLAGGKFEDIATFNVPENKDNTYTVYTDANGFVVGITPYSVDNNKYLYAYAYAYEEKPAGSATSLITGTTSTAASSKVAIVSLNGTASVLELALDKDNKHVSTVAALSGNEAADKSLTATNDIIKYYLDENGKAVITEINNMTQSGSDYTAGSITIGGAAAKSTTTLNLINVDNKNTTGTAAKLLDDTFTAATYTGYKNFPKITDSTYYYKWINDVLYVVAAKEVATTTTSVESIAYLKSIGDWTINGYEYKFIINGKEVVYYNDAADVATKDSIYSKLSVDSKDNTVDFSASTQVTATSAGVNTTWLVVEKKAVTAIDAGYVTANGKNIEYAATNQIVDLTTAGATEIAVGDTITVVAVNDANNKTTTTIFYITAHA